MARWVKPIVLFDGEYRFLSNFSPAPVEYVGLKFPTVEHAYQAAKVDSQLLRYHISIAPTPSAARKLGQKVPLRPDWEAVKLDIMYGLLQQKFAEPTLRTKLLATGEAELVEGNWWGDTFWGVCGGVGQNQLGKLLMRLRAELAWRQK